MKRFISVLVPCALALGAVCGCAPSRPPQAPAELQDARAAYHQAESGPAAQTNQSGLIVARQALDAAERKFDEDPKSDDVRTLGYAAQRKAQIADTDAQTTASLVKEVEQERAMAGRAERRANIALKELGLSAKEEPRGTVITLPGASMFATNQADILPSVKARHTDVAKAVKQVLAERAPEDIGRKMILIGYTDDKGTEQHNLDLSERRAEAVRAFFAAHGLDATLIETQGRGEADPVAQNSTAKGRAENRRVEIVITPPRGATGTPEAQ